ncbi:rod shape-determining protein [uncultured Phascolarctobacterium sp.]|jgi:rod shape-determining protein MreB|uniref:rod shape-determining protein n=1 Tax=uncultured Phascolarctobacterium sp. TaxID=512296 RepID=UPI0025D193BC|nr:rod shape-determining protein MreB [uncultured Phascolarctobacterium sp.]
MFKSMDIGIDLGTANILVYVKGKGVVLKEPSVVAIDKVRNKVLAVGEDAREMLGRAPGSIVAIRPLKEGVIANYTVTQKLLSYVIDKVAGKSVFFKPRVMTCVPIGITSVEKRAVMEATTQGGASKTYLIEEPLAAALGAGIDISVPRGNMVVDIGGGTTDIAVLSLGGIVVSSSIRIGGDHFDEAIVRHVKKVHNVLIGERTAEEIKMQVATVSRDGRQETISVRGRDMVTGLPTTFSVTSEDCRVALDDSVSSLIATVRGVLEKCPPELAADIVDNGIYLTGGGALLDGLAEVMSKETGITTHIADDPLECVALGTGKALENLDKLHPGTVYTASNLDI